MNILKYLSTVGLVCCVFLGCGQVEQTIYLGNVEVNGPIITPPSHIDINKKPGEVTVSPKIAILNNNKKIIGTTDDHYNGTFTFPDQSKYYVNAKNLEWELSDYVFSIDVDVKASRLLSLFGGVNFSGGKNSANLAGGIFGIGLHNNNNPAFRFDAGLNIQKFNYSAVTIVRTIEILNYDREESWDIFGDKGSSVNVNPFFTITVNSADTSGLFNYFGVLGFFSQSILNFNPGETNYNYFPFPYRQRAVDTRANFTNYFFYLSPGISFGLNSQMKLILTAKILKDISINASSVIIIPSAQIDWNF